MTAEKGLPANIDAERAILGSILLENSKIEECKKLSAKAFAVDSHRKIFARMQEMMAANRPVDIVTLLEEFRANKEVDAVGGVAYLLSLTEMLPRYLAVEAYAGIVREKYRLRRLIKLCDQAIERAYDQHEPSDTILAKFKTALEKI